MSAIALQIIEANHAEGVFWALDGVLFQAAEECQAAMSGIRPEPHDSEADRHYFVDVLDEDDSPLREIAISQATAEHLAGRTVGQQRKAAKNRERARKARLAPKPTKGRVSLLSIGADEYDIADDELFVGISVPRVEAADLRLGSTVVLHRGGDAL
ncbi:hypothetical protein [Zhihengliuella halotolerans]|uniref:Uncharacterized protein n=1 Tax=Zhihengliuella halotolerans TaxID=370736 RepID=A0A4Q8ADX8_9MICC|nr:hypothetical protein [Zhihengliuella halotolerans]RZU61759.1 hypothetical protein EV380_1337 [Zhihengliuella halotolerans]